MGHLTIWALIWNFRSIGPLSNPKWPPEATMVNLLPFLIKMDDISGRYCCSSRTKLCLQWKICNFPLFSDYPTNFPVGGGSNIHGFGSCLVQMFSGTRRTIGQLKAWIQKKLRFLGHPKAFHNHDIAL